MTFTMMRQLVNGSLENGFDSLCCEEERLKGADANLTCVECTH